MNETLSSSILAFYTQKSSTPEKELFWRAQLTSSWRLKLLSSRKSTISLKANTWDEAFGDFKAQLNIPKTLIYKLSGLLYSFFVAPKLVWDLWIVISRWGLPVEDETLDKLFFAYVCGLAIAWKHSGEKSLNYI